MELPHYQTIPEMGITGRMDTTKEFTLIGLPEDLHEKSVLDIGCNEGAFMFECLKRKARYVQGIDHSKEWIERASETMKKAEQILGNTMQTATLMETDAVTYFNFSNQKYDLILCLSVTHLIKNPNTLVAKAIEALKENGLLILEINHRLEKEKVTIPVGAKHYGQNKDNRSVYHYIKNNG